MHNDVSATIQRVRDFINKKLEGKPQRLAREAKLNRNTLAGFASNDWNPTAETLSKAMSAVDRLANVPAEELKARKKRKKAKK